MPKLAKVFGWLLLVPGGLFLLMIPFAALDGEPDAAFGMVFLGGLFGVPGGLLLRSGIVRQREDDLQAQMVGFVRAHDSFSISELAAHIGKTPGETQTLLTRDIARYRLPLVMHRASGRYLRLDRLSNTAQVAEQCQSCGGSLGTQIVFEGERLTCPYCGSLVQTHAPAQPSWQHAQGAWMQPPQQQHLYGHHHGGHR